MHGQVVLGNEMNSVDALYSGTEYRYPVSIAVPREDRTRNRLLGSSASHLARARLRLVRSHEWWQHEKLGGSHAL